MKVLWFSLICSTVACFNPIIGKWRIKDHISSPIFTVNENKITSTNGSGIMRGSYKWVCDKNKTMIELEDIEVVQKPPDWFNFNKYYFFIKQFRLVQQMGLKLDIKVLNETEAEVDCLIGDEKVGNFVIEQV
jgi:hypothetical protein